MDINKNIAIWRGSNTPPTPYHLWLKDDKLYHYDGISWKENKIDLSTEEKDGLMSKEDKEKLYNLEDKLNELNLSAYLIRGSVETLDDIPYENLLSGDVYNILNPFYIDEKRYPEGTNVVWTGNKLDPLGGTVDFKDYSTTGEVENMISNSSDKLLKRIDNLELSKVNMLLRDLLLHTVNISNPHNVTKALVGLGNVDNTSDINKPISTALLNALNQKVDKTYVEEQLETKADKADVDEQRISYVSPCFADCTETHEAKLKSITLAASIIPSKAIFSVTLKIANNLTLLNQSPVYMHLVDISGNIIGVSQNAVKQVQNKGKYVTWFFDSAINTTGTSFVIKLHTTNSASNANNSNFVGIIAHVSQDGGVEGIGVTSDDGTYHTDWTPAIGINVVNLAAIYPQIKELQKYRMAYATSELPDISTTGHKANINEIRISQTTMGISLVSSVSLMVASDNAYSGELYLKVHDINGNLVATSNNSVNLSQNLGAYVTWYFTPFQLIDDAIYRFAAWDNSDNKQVMRIHVASGKSEGVTCFDQNDSPHTDYCPALGINIEPIVTNNILSKINDVELLVSGKLLTLYVGTTSNKYLLKDGDTIRFNFSSYRNYNLWAWELKGNDNISLADFILTPATELYAGLLSPSDYSNLQTIQRGAQVNVIESIKVGDVELEISDKLVNIPIASSDDILSILN